MKLKRYEINALANAIRYFDGRVEIAKDNDGKVLGLLQKPFDLSGKARYALAKSLRLISGQINDYDKTQKGLKEQYKDEPQKFEEENRKFMYEEDEIELYKIQISELQIDANKVSPSIISDLMPILEGEIA